MNRTNNQNGMTLIELLVVIVILGIIALIAILGFQKIIQNSKDQAFLANAYALKDAAEKYYLSSGVFTQETATEIIDYETLVSEGFIEAFKDPDRNELMPSDGHDTFVQIEKETSGTLRYFICYIGDQRQLCDEDNNGILFQDLAISLITEKKD